MSILTSRVRYLISYAILKLALGPIRHKDLPVEVSRIIFTKDLTNLSPLLDIDKMNTFVYDIYISWEADFIRAFTPLLWQNWTWDSVLLHNKITAHFYIHRFWYRQSTLFQIGRTVNRNLLRVLFNFMCPFGIEKKNRTALKELRSDAGYWWH